MIVDLKIIVIKIIVLFSYFFCTNLFSELLIKIDDKEEKINLTLYGFNNNNSKIADVSTKILQIIKKNLEIIDRFSLNEGRGVFKNISNNNSSLLSDKIPDFSYYNRNETDIILVADFAMKSQDSDSFELRIRLWDILDNKQLFGKYYFSKNSNYRYLANEISDNIFIKMMNEKIGHFNNKILYISESGSVKQRIKKLAIMDFNSDNHKFITNGRDLVLTPIFFQITI